MAFNSSFGKQSRIFWNNSARKTYMTLVQVKPEVSYTKSTKKKKKMTYGALKAFMYGNSNDGGLITRKTPNWFDLSSQYRFWPPTRSSHA